MVLIGVMLFNTFITLSGFGMWVSAWVAGAGISPTMFLIMVVALYVPLGALMDELSMMLLTVPLYIPTVNALGIDLIWFGILVILSMQIGAVAPPVGLLAFVTKGVTKEPSLETVYRGCIPFIVAAILVMALLIAVPDLSLFVISMME